MTKVLDITGKTFERLTVLKRVESDRWGSARWECLCSCGNIVVVDGLHLRRGETKSCGCLRNETSKVNAKKAGESCKKSFGESSLNKVFYQYKSTAKRYDRCFEIDFDYFKKITQRECFYCGRLPSTIQKNKYSNGDYIYNGIDRIDSSKGYTKDNCVTCCNQCNMAKNATSQQEFLQWIERVYNYSIKKEN